MFPPRGPESPQRPGALCVLSTAAISAPGAVPNIQPTSRAVWGLRAGNNMEKLLLQRGAHILMGEADNSNTRTVRAVEKTIVRERVSEGRESWVVQVGL